MSPALLSKRLKELEAGGIIERVIMQGPGGTGYVLTPAGRALGDVVETIGRWGQRWLETHLSLQNLDPSLLMWDMRRRLNPDPMPPGRAVIQFLYPELPAIRRQWWLVVQKGKEIDLCSIDPGFDVNLYVVTALRTMTSIWMGLSTLDEELKRKTIRLTGDAALQQSMSEWLGLNHFAKVERR